MPACGLHTYIGEGTAVERSWARREKGTCRSNTEKRFVRPMRGWLCRYFVHKNYPGLADSHSRGLFAGLSLEGGVIVSRPDVNRKFYGRHVSVRWGLGFRVLLAALLDATGQCCGPQARSVSLFLFFWGKNYSLHNCLYSFFFCPLTFPQYRLLNRRRHRRMFTSNCSVFITREKGSPVRMCQAGVLHFFPTSSRHSPPYFRHTQSPLFSQRASFWKRGAPAGSPTALRSPRESRVGCGSATSAVAGVPGRLELYRRC